MSRAGSLARAFGSDGALNIADIGNVAATAVPYSNAVSGISANTVQEAIDYLNTLSSGGAGSVASYTRQKFTATAGQTTFTVTAGYTVGYLQVFMNGILLDVSDYAAADGSTVVLTAAAAANDEIVTIALDSFNIAELLRVTNISASASTNAITLDADSAVNIPRLNVNGATSGEYVEVNGRFSSRHASFPSYIFKDGSGNTQGEVYLGLGGKDLTLINYNTTGSVRMVANGVEGLYMDSAGRVKTSAQPAWNVFSVDGEGTQLGSGGSFANGINSSTNGAFTRGGVSAWYANGAVNMTAPVTGAYLVIGKRHTFFSSSSQWTEFRILVNGNSHSSGHQGHISGAYTTDVNAVVLYAVAGDTISFGDGGGTPVQLHGHSNFSGYFLG